MKVSLSLPQAGLVKNAGPASRAANESVRAYGNVLVFWSLTVASGKLGKFINLACETYVTLGRKFRSDGETLSRH